MNRRLTGSLACVIVLVVAVAAVSEAQRRGGAPPGAGGPGRGGRGGAGAIERITVHGKALEGNLEGDSPDREVTVYLPPSYTRDQNRRFPVIYLLHGYGGRDTLFTDEQSVRLQESADRLAAAQGFSEFIVVTPNAFTLHKGSMYSNSVTTGDWERFIADDLVGYVDSHYRTLVHRMSRGLAGHSMGGYGALRIGMKRPEVFANLYSMSACCLTVNRDPVLLPSFEVEQPEWMAAAEAIKTRAQAEEAARVPGFGASVVLGWAAAWSPNPKNPPLFLDLPVRNGKVRPEIVAKWAANAPLEMIQQYASNLNLYYAIAMDIGTADSLLESNRQLHAAMTRLRIPHTFEEYDGDHVNRIPERIEKNLLPFFARHLAAPSNLTSPAPAADRLSKDAR